MPEAEIVLEIVSLARARHPSAVHLLDRLTALTARRLPGCCAATATLWAGDRPLESSASHLDLAALRHLPLASPDSLERQALATGVPLSIPDTLALAGELPFAAGSAGFGIRSLVIQPARAGSVAATFGFYATRPHAFDGADLCFLARQATGILQDASEQEELADSAQGAQASMQSRSVIDQAIGIVMATRACTPEQALTTLRELSQAGNIKLADVATQLVTCQSAGDPLPAGDPPPAADPPSAR